MISICHLLTASFFLKVVVGEHITFHCQASGNPTPVTRWYRNKERLQPDTNYIIMKGSKSSLILIAFKG